MYSLTFQPFVGKHYSLGGIFGKRIMVLGDSHYGDVPDSEITHRVMEWYLDDGVERESWIREFGIRKLSKNLVISLLFRNFTV